jgi:hypothetical protein
MFLKCSFKQIAWQTLKYKKSVGAIQLAMLACFSFGHCVASDSVTWRSKAGQVFLQSDHLTPPPEGMVVEIGGFSNGFIPRELNRKEWLLHWVPLAETQLVTQNQSFEGTETLASNSQPFRVSDPVYLWAHYGHQPGSEELLISKSAWHWPDTSGNSSASVIFETSSSAESDIIKGNLRLSDEALITSVVRGSVSYPEWVANTFSADDRQDIRHIGRHADPDADGVVNFLEYALGTDPLLAFDHAGLPGPLSLPQKGVPYYPEFSIKANPDADIFWSAEVTFQELKPFSFRTLETFSMFPGGSLSDSIRLISSEEIPTSQPHFFSRLIPCALPPSRNRLISAVSAHFDLNLLPPEGTEKLQNVTFAAVGNLSAPVQGKVGKAIKLDASQQQYLVAADASKIFPNDGKSLGFSIWVKPNSILGAGQAIFGCGTTSSSEILLWAKPGSITLNMRRRFGGGTEIISFNHELSIGEWSCIQGWYDSEGANINLMVNGEALASKPAFSGVAPITGSLFLGYGRLSSTVSRNFFDGEVDEAIFWSGQKSLDEIVAISKAGQDGETFPFPSFHQNFDKSPMHVWSGEGNKGIRYDKSGNGRPLTSDGFETPDVGVWNFDGVDDRQSSGDIPWREGQSLVVTARFDDLLDRSLLKHALPDGSGLEVNVIQGRIQADLIHSDGEVQTLTSDPLIVETSRPMTFHLSFNGLHARLDFEGKTKTIPSSYTGGNGTLSVGKTDPTLNSGISPFKGQLHEIKIFDRLLTLPQIIQEHDHRYAIECWGDSLTTTLVGGGGSNWTGKLSHLRGGNVVNPHGFGGQSTEAILSHFEAYNLYRKRIHIIWSGNNSWGGGVQSETEKIARLVCSLNSDRYLIVGLPNRSNPELSDEAIGEVGSALSSINYRLGEIYGSRFVDFQAIMLRDYSPVNEDDTTDLAREILPRSMRDMAFTGSHLSEAGAVFLANMLHERLIELGWGIDE